MITPDWIVKLPTRQEEERAKAFQVNNNYLGAVAMYLIETYGSPPEMGKALVAAQHELRGFQRLKLRRDLDKEAISRLLTISWASEVQLRLGALVQPTMLRFSNAWAPVFSYYAVYMAMQAWFCLNRMGNLTDDHTSSLRTISHNVVFRDLFPLPWAVYCTGCPQLKESTFERVPGDQDAHAHVELLSRPSMASFWPRYCKMLETTRVRRLERNFREWKRSRDRRAIRADEKRKVDSNLSPTTLFDFLWRLRVRSNYKDVGSFLTWTVTDHEHDDFYRSIVVATDATCTLLHSLVATGGFRDFYEATLDEFLRSSSAELLDSMSFLKDRSAAILG